jgi:predicted permease
MIRWLANAAVPFLLFLAKMEVRMCRSRHQFLCISSDSYNHNVLHPLFVDVFLAKGSRQGKPFNQQTLHSSSGE